MRTIAMAVVVLAALVGCSKGGGKDAVGSKGQTDPGKSPEAAISEAINENMVRPEGHYDIKDAGEAWDKSGATLAGLGAQMDTKAKSTKNALCRALVTFDDPSTGNLTGRPEIKIQDAKTFEVQYMIPETEGAYNRIKGNGKLRAELGDDGWVQMSSFSTKPKPMTESEVVAWPRRFPLEMFGHYTKGSDVWQQLFSAWQRGVGGYSAIVEEQTFKQGGKSASHYRVLAKTQKGGGTTIEVIVDKKFLRPLTVRVDGTLDDGRKYSMFWSGEWQSGGTYDAGEFAIPQPKPRSAKAT